MDDYELLDVGGGARLERFGPHITDRPFAGADRDRRSPAQWQEADLRFDRDGGWSGRGVNAASDGWTATVADLELELRPTEAGQVGVFPEHAAMLPWLRERVATRLASDPPTPVSVLNLFAYTGLATLALALAGAAVTHVDASRPTVTWARHNAERSGLADRPIRWIVDDAVAFSEREIRRGRRYAGVVLDPPSYGHGPGGRDWRIEDDLPGLLTAVAGLLEPDGFLLLTAHTPGFEGDRLARLIRDSARRPSSSVDAGDLELLTADGRRLELGAFARWSGRS